MVEVMVPRPAATVLPLRDRPEGYEILMLRRNIRSDFMGGAYVFPGGGVDERDASTDRLIGLDDGTASRHLELESGGIAYYVACLRELFEEGGLLIACYEDGRAVDISGPEDAARMADHRRRVNAKESDFLSVIEEERLLLDCRGIEYLAHWITPPGGPRRYDTRFFVVSAPPDQVAMHDAAETVDSRWLRPRDALAANEREEIQLMTPTIRNLEPLVDFETAAEVLAYVHALESIPCVAPDRRESNVPHTPLLLPGDPGYTEKTG